MNQELINRAKAAKSPDELLKMAHESGMEDFTEESAKAYYDLLHKSGELSDDELDSAAGGCKKGGRRIVTVGLDCPGYSKEMNMHLWKCDKCQKNDEACNCYPSYNPYQSNILQLGIKDQCGTCGWCTYERGMWYCNNPTANQL